MEETDTKKKAAYFTAKTMRTLVQELNDRNISRDNIVCVLQDEKEGTYKILFYE